jgi:transposase
MKMDYFIGIDVSKRTLDIAMVREGELVLEERIDNDTLSIRSFLKRLLTTLHLSVNQITVCMEHTGIYNAPALEVLWKKKINTCLQPGLQIKQSQGMTRGKNDRVDARRIAIYAFKNRHELTFWKPQRPVVQELSTLLAARERLVKVQVQLQVPLKESVGFVEPSIVRKLKVTYRRSLKSIQADLQDIETQLDQLIASDQIVSNQVKTITSIPGVGCITAMNMITATEEFSKISEAKKFACYAGVAPFEHSSGTSIRGKTRVSKMANMTLKKLLHLAAMSAIQCNPELKNYYTRKVNSGKNKMSVINAVRNKLISRVFACINHDRPYEKNYQYALV